MKAETSAIVYRSTGSWYTVKFQSQWIQCRIKGRLRLKGIKSTNPVAVGDRVIITLENDTEGIITEVLPRENYIIRKSVNLSKQTHIIAANIDQVFLLITLNNPPTFTAFIDRFLVTAEAYQIPAVLVFNKLDTYSTSEKDTLKSLKELYEAIGYDCYSISALNQEGVDQIRSLMRNKVSMFSGHSGVGKSTLINAIAPNLNLKTAAISQQHQQGQHTTTFAEMFDLPDDCRIIDTPGIKGFGVVDMEPEEIGPYFVEFEQFLNQCKFHNCRHDREPQCGVKDALDRGEIAASRYRSYLQLLEDDSQYR